MIRTLGIRALLWQPALAPAAPQAPEGTWHRKAPLQGTLRVVPSFSGAMDGPAFVLAFTNTSSEPTDALNVVTAESVLLDGKSHPHQVVTWAGSIAAIPPGGTWSHTVVLFEFLAGGERLQYSESLKRWRWRLPLKSGTHTVTFRVGPSASDVLRFVWDGETPVLYR